MFKNIIPFKKGKEGSENPVGRDVGLDGRDIIDDENKQIENISAVSAAIPNHPQITPRKSGALSAIKLLVGASSSKKLSSNLTTSTPGRKLLQKIICTPGKSKSFSDTSIEELDDFGGGGSYSHNNNRSFIVDHFNTVRELEVEETSSNFETTNFVEMPSTPPRLARKLLADQDINTNLDDRCDKQQKMKTSGKQSTGDQLVSSGNINSSKKIDDALEAASNSPGINDDMVFSTNSSSSDDEFDHQNENNNDASMSSRTALSYASPPNNKSRDDDRQSSPSDRHIPMKMSPGIGIPTPAISKLRETSSGSYVEDSGSNLPFPHPLRSSIPDSPTMIETNNTTPNPKNLSIQFEEEGNDDDDDDAFLPDDFKSADESPTSELKQTFASYEVDKMIQNAKREERMCLRQEHDKETAELHNEFDKIMMESGSQWKRDADEEATRYERLLKEEKHKTSQKHHELINKEQSLEDIKLVLNETETEREFLRLQVSELENAAEKMSTVASSNDSKIQEMESLQKAKSEADDRISDLERELNDNKVSSAESLQQYQASNEELTTKLSATEIELSELRKQKDVEADLFITLKNEKDMADREVVDLSERLRIQSESNNQSLNQLEEAEKEITNLKTQVTEFSSNETSSSEEIRLATIEIDNLKSLRVEDEKQIETLQVQLSRIEEEHQAVYSSIEEEHQRAALFSTPQKSRSLNSSYSESPCLEIDILRVDNNKAQGQLKAMGKVLKRYKSERDDVKTKIKELEQRQIQTIEIAVKQATQDQKEKNQLLTEENEELRQKPVDIGEKMVEEMKDHIEELKKRHTEEISQIRESSDTALADNTRAQLEEQHKTLEAEFQLQTKELIESHRKKIDSLLLEIEQIRTNHDSEVTLTKTKSKEEIDGLHDELRQIKIEFDTKSKVAEEHEGQIKVMHKMHGEEIELIRSESREEVDDFRDKLNKLQKDLDANPSEAATEEIMKTMKSKFDEDLEQVKGKAKSDQDRLQSEIDSLMAEKNGATQKANKLESQIGEIQQRNTARIEKDKIEYDHLVREITAGHAKEGDEMLAQLDLIEAEAVERCKKAENAVKDKDAVIAAMGYQLAESSQQHDMLKNEIEPLRIDLEKMKAENKTNLQEITKLIAQHSKEIEDQVVLRDNACNEAREEMIEMAEKQLEDRQGYYRTIKKELDNAQSRISVLDRDLRLTKKELEEMSTRHEAREADLKDEIAQARAQSATREANLIRAERVHYAELKKAKDAEKTMKSKLEESQATSQSVQSTLAALVSEKERMSQELIEVTAISEELAALCEENKLM
jgi:hypothetical protein